MYKDEVTGLLYKKEGDAFSYLDTREVDKRTYFLLNRFGFHDPVHGLIVAEATFTTNYASLDALRNVVLFPFYALLADYGDKAATIHDWLYSGYPIIKSDGSHYYPSRAEIDEIFFRALREEGIARWRAGMFYSGVRIGGESHFSSEQKVWQG